MKNGVEIKKVDSQGRIFLPANWRNRELQEERIVYILKREGYLKIIPKKRGDLTSLFDKLDLGVEAIGEWSIFKKSIEPLIT
ncbi:MAG: AbrB family transcriptional regulator [Candidatus Bathyarchaeota archaeon]